MQRSKDLQDARRDASLRASDARAKNAKAALELREEIARREAAERRNEHLERKISDLKIELERTTGEARRLATSFAHERDEEKRRRHNESRLDQERQSRLALELEAERDESERLLSQSITAMHLIREKSKAEMDLVAAGRSAKAADEVRDNRGFFSQRGDQDSPGLLNLATIDLETDIVPESPETETMRRAPWCEDESGGTIELHRNRSRVREFEADVGDSSNSPSGLQHSSTRTRGRMLLKREFQRQ